MCFNVVPGTTAFTPQKPPFDDDDGGNKRKDDGLTQDMERELVGEQVSD